MDTQSTLSVAAEVGIGVAGFSSIATAVLSRSNPDQFDTLWVQMRTLLLTSLAVITLAYIPMVLGASALEEETLWMLGSGIYAGWVLITLVVFISGYRKLSRQSGNKRVVANVTLVAALTSLTLNCSNVLIMKQAWPYLAALGCGLIVTFSQFVSLVRIFWDLNRPNSP